MAPNAVVARGTAIACVLLAGCGSSIAASPGARGGKSRNRQIVSVAQAVNLRLTDVPGWTELPAAEPGPTDDIVDPRYARCVGAVPLKPLARASSPTFVRGKLTGQSQLTHSVVVITPNAASAAREIARIHTARGRACIERSLRGAPHGEGVRLRVRGYDWAHPNGAPPAFKLRLTLAATGLGAHRPFPIYLDLIGFARGRTLIFLVAEGWRRPPSIEAERRLTALLGRRATAAGM